MKWNGKNDTYNESLINEADLLLLGSVSKKTGPEKFCALPAASEIIRDCCCAQYQSGLGTESYFARA